MNASLTRREFLECSAVGTTLAAASFLAEAGRCVTAYAGSEIPEKVYLKSWELLELPALTMRPDKDGIKRALRITATSGAMGVMPARLCKGFSDATVEILKTNDLLDHEKLYDLMVANKVPLDQLKSADIVCWDLHARMLNRPLHALLGSKRAKVLRYGDVRGQQPNFSPQKYAENVANYLKRTGLQATKLHFPGNMGTPESISFEMVKETLRAVRAATGPGSILAWDPYPGSAESATNSVDEAKQILQLMDELGYAWIEGPLPPVPFDRQIPKYVELMKTGTKQRIQAEGPGSSIGDGTPFEVMKHWAEAGAISQCSTDVYIANGVTNAVRMIEYAKRHPPLVINLHWAWMPHAHLAMACDEALMPLVEFPMGEDFPRSLLDGPHLLAPDWPGIYHWEAT